MDEPLSNLDAKLRVQMRADIAALQSRPRDDDGLRHARPGRGDDARPPGRRPAGRRSSSSATRRARSTSGPANTFVAGFIGSPSMNLCTRAARTNGAVSLGGDAVSRCRTRQRPAAHERRRRPPARVARARAGRPRRPGRGGRGARRRRIRLLHRRVCRAEDEARRAGRRRPARARRRGYSCGRASPRRCSSIPSPESGSADGARCPASRKGFRARRRRTRRWSSPTALPSRPARSVSTPRVRSSPVGSQRRRGRRSRTSRRALRRRGARWTMCQGDGVPRRPRRFPGPTTRSTRRSSPSRTRPAQR